MDFIGKAEEGTLADFTADFTEGADAIVGTQASARSNNALRANRIVMPDDRRILNVRSRSYVQRPPPSHL
jgi:hypothetical protein